MDLTLWRIYFTDKSTIGELDVDTRLECNTLELTVKDGLPGSAIPPGKYQVTIAFSPHFQRNMPLLVGVPNRSGIEIHKGDYPHNTEGCILLGKYNRNTPDQLEPGTSTPAFDAFYTKIEEAAAAGNCWITVYGGREEIGPSSISHAVNE